LSKDQVEAGVVFAVEGMASNKSSKTFIRLKTSVDMALFPYLVSEAAVSDSQDPKEYQEELWQLMKNPQPSHPY